MKFDDILKQIGGFGPYQKRLYALVILPNIFTGFHTFSGLFILGEQSHRCSFPDDYKTSLSNDSSYNISSLYGNFTEARALECKTELFSTETNQTKIITCSSWQYDKSVFESSAVSDFNLVCQKKVYRSHAELGYFMGFLAGAAIMGTLGDILGRKPVACLCCMLMFAASLALTWAPNLVVFAILRFVIGTGAFGYWTQSFIIGLELVCPSKRVFAGIMIEWIFCLGEIILCGLAYFIRDWRTLELVLAAPSALLLIYWCFLPESARWLLSRGRTKETVEIVKKIAKVNKKDIDGKLDEIEYHEEKISFKEALFPLLKSRVLVVRWVVLTCSWFAVAFTYYGITHNVGRIGGNLYLNFTISIIVEFIGYSSVLFLANRLGRKAVHCGSFLIAGSACLTSIVTRYLDQSLFWIMILLSNIGKCCVSACFGNIFLYTSELFPTNVRSFVLGSANVGARIGTIVAPYIAHITDTVHTDFGQALPLILFGCVALSVGLASLTIPETLNTKLPETVDDAVHLKKVKTEHLIEKELKTNTCV